MNDDTTPQWRRLRIDNLPPAAARLLLALSTAQSHESESGAMERSGIAEVPTYLTAYRLLEERGFIIWRDGLRYITLYMQEPAKLTDERYSYPGTTMVTKAKLPQ